MIFIAVEEISQNLLAYLQRVETGETLVLTQMGKPFAEIKPLAVVVNGLRPYGLASGEFTVPVDFDDSLPEEILQDFEGV